MKNLIYLVLLTGLFVGVFGSCSKKDPVTEIPLPQQSLVGINRPRITGSLSEYIEIPASSYILDLHDSIPRLSIKIRVSKAKETSSLMNSEILLDSTYVTLVDSLSKDLIGLVLKPDTIQLKTLNKLLETEGVYGELTFIGDKVTEDFKDSLAMNAVNFNMHGAVGYQLKESDIEAMIKRWAQALKTMNSCVVPPAFVPGMYINAYRNSYNESHRIRRLLENCKGLMNETQKKSFDSLNKRTPRRSII